MILRIINCVVPLFAVSICLLITLTWLGQIKFLIVKTGSMTPVLPINSAALIVPRGSLFSFGKYSVGDIVSFKRLGAGPYITHRIIKIVSPEVYLVKGDANPGPDETPVFRKYLLGRVAFAIPFVGNVLKFLTNPLALVLLVVFPGSVIILREVWAIQEELSFRHPGLDPGSSRL